MSANIPGSVFLVEDQPLVVNFLTDCLEDAGYRVVGSAESGEQALETIPALSPDLVLMDIRLAGDLDGIGTALALRSRCKVPVIFLTGSHEGETRNRACVAAPYGFLTKPVRRASVIASVESAMARKRAERNEHVEARPAAGDDELTGLPNRQRFLEQVAAWAAGAGSASATLCLCDLDRFGAVNETLGRDAGDRLLRRFASLLRAGGSPLLCRMEADRFCVVFPGAGLPEVAARLEDIRLAFFEDSLKKALPVTARFGIGLLQASRCDIDEALRAAERELGNAKQRGGNCVSAGENDCAGDLLALYGALGSWESPGSRQSASQASTHRAGATSLCP